MTPMKHEIYWQCEAAHTCSGMGDLFVRRRARLVAGSARAMEGRHAEDQLLELELVAV